MRPYDIIYKKREGKKLNKKEINYLINGYSTGQIPDYQMSAWAMTVFFQGLDTEETAWLTDAMVNSGEKIDLSEIKGTIIDKHSTGGVGDTTTLVVAPLVAAAGIPVAKMSGKGLGHTGGTIDKLESIPGFNTSLSRQKFIKNVNETGMAIASQTEDLAPADKKLYALRDVTATVDSIPLIASSIMSKKIAGGADGIVLDVKTGKGAFMKDIKKSEELARIMVDTGKRIGKNISALITDMNQPLGKAIGNSLEVIEAIKTLKGKGPDDLQELSLVLGASMLLISGKVKNQKEGYNLLNEILKSGKALKQFTEFIITQGGNPRVVEDYSLLPQAKNKVEVKSNKKGYVNALDALSLGLLSMELGAGRKTKEDKIDMAAGIVLNKKTEDRVAKNEPLAVLYSNTNIAQEHIEKALNSFSIKPDKPDKTKLIYKIIN